MIDALRESAQSFVNLRIWLAILAASLWGASLGLINYYIGRKGLPVIRERFPQIDPDKLRQYHNWYERWGARVLLLSSIPVLGTLLRLGAGIYGIGFAPFLIWSLIALLIRNWMLFLLLSAVIGGI